MNQYCKLALVMLVLLPFSSCKQAEEEVSIKNLLVIIGDDHSARALGCYGNDIVRTPNLDRLAEEGVMFTNAYYNAPVCSASWQSLLIGKYPHSTGVTLLRTPFKDESNITIAEHLRSLGYATGIVGKTHFNNSKTYISSWIEIQLYSLNIDAYDITEYLVDGDNVVAVKVLSNGK